MNAEKEHKSNRKHQVIAIVIICLVSVLLIYSWYNAWLNATDYWNGFAPNGQYDIFVDTDLCVNYQTHKVKLPLCESSGGDLHGEWSFTDDVTFLPYEDSNITHCGYYRVILEGNIIRLAWQLGRWNFTKGDWEFG